MASKVETSIAICELIGTMELQTWCGQYTRKVLRKMPPDISDAILHRIYPCIRWLQGVSSIINALKKGKVGFGTIAAGKIVSKKLDVLRRNSAIKAKKTKERASATPSLTSILDKNVESKKERGEGGVGEGGEKNETGLVGLATEAKRRSASEVKKRSLTKVKGAKGRGTVRLSQALGTLTSLVGHKEAGEAQKKATEVIIKEVAAGVPRKGSSKDMRARVAADAKRDSKMMNMSAAYGANNKAHKRMKAKSEDEEVATAATFRGVSWATMMMNTKTRIRESIRMGLFKTQGGIDSQVSGMSIGRLKSDGRPVVSRQFSSGKALKLGIDGISTERSNINVPELGKEKGIFSRTKTILGLSGGTNKDKKLRAEALKQAAEETREFWKPEFDVKAAIAEPVAMSETSKEGSEEDENDITPELRGYIEMLKDQQSLRQVSMVGGKLK